MLSPIIFKLNQNGYQSILTYSSHLPVILVYDNPRFIDAYTKDKTLGGILSKNMLSRWQRPNTNDVYLSDHPKLIALWNNTDDIIKDKR